MSYSKSSMKNGINCMEAQWIKNNNLVDTTVKLAGEEAKDRLYEPKHKKKLVRVLTVIAYVFFVSLAAIMLSLYYVFLWNGGQKKPPKYTIQPDLALKCDEYAAEMQQQLTDLTSLDNFEILSTTPPTEINTVYDVPFSPEDDYVNGDTFAKKEYQHSEND